MHARVILRVAILLLGIICGAMWIVTAFVPLLGDERSIAVSWACSSLFMSLPAACGAWWMWNSRKAPTPTPSLKDGFAGVGLGWLAAVFSAAFPFWNVLKMRWPDAIFEASSGLSTTGASVLADGIRLGDATVLTGAVLDNLPRSLLFWRAILNWLGGIGIIYFVLLILPMMHGGQGKMLYNAEVPGLKTAGDQLTPRLSTAMKLVLAFYCLLTLLAIGVYWALGMTRFDAVCHAFSTVSTGGFSPHSEGMAIYGTRPLLQWSIVLFMFISACNFSLFLRSFSARRFLLWQDEEFRFFSCMFAIAVLFAFGMLWWKRPDGVMTLNGVNVPRGVEGYLRIAAFQMASLVSTTGFATSDYLTWNVPAVTLLIAGVMIPCGCGGSTAGGMKVGRLLVVFKQLRNEIIQCLSPRRLLSVHLNGERIEPSLIGKTMAFAVLYLLLILGFAFLVAVLDNADLGTALGASLTCVSNVGPGFGKVGPAGSFTAFSPLVKFLLSLAMIAGRLELYTMLVMVFPSFWEKS